VTVRRGKGGKARVSVFGPGTAKALWRLQRAAEGPSVFNLSESGVSQRIALLARISGVPIRPHMFRHRWAHDRLAGGMTEGDLMTLGGWETSKQIHETYGKTLAQERAIAAGLRFFKAS
jgi:integrase